MTCHFCNGTGELDKGDGMEPCQCTDNEKGMTTKKKGVRKYQQYQLGLPIFRTTILLAFGGTNDDFERAYKEWTGCEVPSIGEKNVNGRTLWNDSAKDEYAIWCRTLEPGLVAHEATHLIHRLLQDKGISFDDELIGYMIQHIVEEYFVLMSPKNR